MIRIILPFVIQIVLITNACGQGADFNKAADIYLSRLEESATAALYTSCKTNVGKAVLIFGLDGKQGVLFELKDQRVVNSAPLIIKHKNITIDITEAQGGIYTYTVMENHVKDLLNLPFKFVMPENLNGIFMSMPTYVCVQKPPK